MAQYTKKKASKTDIAQKALALEPKQLLKDTEALETLSRYIEGIEDGPYYSRYYKMGYGQDSIQKEKYFLVLPPAET